MYLQLCREICLFFPDIPRYESLKQQHLQPILCDCAHFFGTFHKQCGIGVVEQIVADMLGCESFVGNGRTFIHIGIHAYGSSVYDNFIILDDFGCKFTVSYHTVLFGAGDHFGFYSSLCNACTTARAAPPVPSTRALSYDPFLSSGAIESPKPMQSLLYPLREMEPSAV